MRTAGELAGVQGLCAALIGIITALLAERVPLSGIDLGGEWAMGDVVVQMRLDDPRSPYAGGFGAMLARRAYAPGSAGRAVATALALMRCRHPLRGTPDPSVRLSSGRRPRPQIRDTGPMKVAGDNLAHILANRGSSG